MPGTVSETIEAAISESNKRALSDPMLLPKPRKDRKAVKCVCAYMRVRVCAYVCARVCSALKYRRAEEASEI